MAEPKPKRRRSATKSAAEQDSEWQEEVEQLSFNEARTALELAMAKLQSSDLEVEEMATLYRRAEGYANRCSAVLESVEQDVIQWDNPSA
jgi:exodeoxyribonuclease VII small subunit